MKFQYVIVIKSLVLILFGCQTSKKEIFELPEVRKNYIQKIEFKEAEFDIDTKSYHLYFSAEDYVYTISWRKKDSLIAESYRKGRVIEIFTYEQNKLSSKTKSRRGEFNPFYKEDIADNAEQTEDSIFYYLKNK
ncbi:hypothetical protein [Leptospira neocaledonica]|uniref:hypothetical protein n=1 Tax=Leptospira neocaledonica TaxID=2023192 RepID=UPI0013FD30C1|nr:hypothetical protein [Leptospira neocaledonica]